MVFRFILQFKIWCFLSVCAFSSAFGVMPALYSALAKSSDTARLSKVRGFPSRISRQGAVRLVSLAGQREGLGGGQGMFGVWSTGSGMRVWPYPSTTPDIC